MDFTSLTPQQVLELGTPCEELKELLKTSKPPKLDWSNPSQTLGVLRHLVNQFDEKDQKDLEVDEETLLAPARDGFMLPIKVFRPAGKVTTNLPLIVLYFGGAFILGSPTTLAGFARSLVKRFDAVVVAPTYRLAPEHPFPTGINDGWDTFSWIAGNAISTLHTDPSKGFIIGGLSSGGNISNIVAHLARDNGVQPPITGVWLSCAAARIAPKDADQLPEKYRERNLSRSQDECVNSMVTTPEMAKFTKEALKPDLDSQLFAPMTWPTGHQGFPKTYSQVCGMDAARDEALIFDDMLKNEGTATRLDLYAGLPHAFFHSFKDLRQSKEWENDTMKGFEWLLAD